ncbi:hypothetical protein niasHT_031595 [Heterodera trifolii]|uniref:SET domain-containing protein n=1 Tax=Heterodera trifolii TaxID=157864 RepID=A0ABD2J3C6_9BILA
MAYNGFKNVTVDQHFYVRHRICLRYANNPCVIEKNKNGHDRFYPLELNGQQYQLDALRKGNLARFVNHSCQPNCCAVLITTAVPIASTATVGDQHHQQHGQQQVPYVLVFALRHIFAGEEITLDYGEPWWLSKACPCLCGNEKCKYDRDWWANLVQNGTNLAQGYGKQMACKSTKDGTNLAWAYGKQMACKSTNDGTNLALSYGKQMACKSTKDGTNLAWAYGKQMACKSAKDGTNLAWAYGKQMACKTAAPLPLQLQQHTARKSVVTLPMALSRIEVGPSFGNLPCIDMKLTGDQLAQLLNME